MLAGVFDLEPLVPVFCIGLRVATAAMKSGARERGLLDHLGGDCRQSARVKA